MVQIKTLCNFSQLRFISYKKFRTWYANLVPAKSIKPPYNHIVQIGDPRLRIVAEHVPDEQINSPEMEFLIYQMKKTFNKYNCVGLSAPQIGVGLRVILVEMSKKHLKNFSEEEQKTREMSLLPLTVIINPAMKILDYSKATFPESCESIKGLWAEVPRYRSVELTGKDESGQFIILKAMGWNARIIQHEIDHINGKLYTDIMERKSLTCSCWDIINQRGGRVELPYSTD